MLIAATQTALRANVPASTTNAHPAPIAATRKPPIAGPASRAAAWRTSWSSAFAWTSSSRATTSGTIAPNAGPKNASPIPMKTDSTTRCQISIAPVSDSTPIAMSATARTTSAATSTRRRSTRSVTTPPVSRNATMPSVQAVPTIDSATGSLSRS